MIGFFALTALHGRRLSHLFQEKIDLWIEIEPDAMAGEAGRLVRYLQSRPYVKPESVQYIPREEAVAQMRQDLGEESLLTELPDLMRDVIRFNVRADMLDEDAMTLWKSELRADTAVADVFLEATSVGNVGKNIERIGYIALGMAVLLIFAAVVLIHNTLRLALYANRFLIKNQELVGASWGYISKPFVVRGILNGLWSAGLAIAALLGLLYAAQKVSPDIADLEDPVGVAIIMVALTVLGVAISGLSTWLVVNKFLRLRIDDLY